MVFSFAICTFSNMITVNTEPTFGKWGLGRTTLVYAPELPTYITFHPAVMVAALLAGLGPGLLATALTVAAADYWIASPKGVFFHGTAAESAGVVLWTK